MFEDALCGCGRPVKYSSFDGRGGCSKYGRCLSYEEQEELIKDLQNQVVVYKPTLEKIVRVNAMDYEYKTWAKETLDKIICK